MIIFIDLNFQEPFPFALTPEDIPHLVVGLSGENLYFMLRVFFTKIKIL